MQRKIRVRHRFQLSFQKNTIDKMMQENIMYLLYITTIAYVTHYLFCHTWPVNKHKRWLNRMSFAWITNVFNLTHHRKYQFQMDFFLRFHSFYSNEIAFKDLNTVKVCNSKQIMQWQITQLKTGVFAINWN